MQFKRLIQAELPFTLNLPSGIYKVPVNGAAFSLQLLQGQIAVAMNAKELAVGNADEMSRKLVEKWNSAYKHKLRTLVALEDVVNQSPSDSVVATEEQVMEAMEEDLVRDAPLDYARDKQKLQSDARSRLSSFNDEQIRYFKQSTGIRLTAKVLFPDSPDAVHRYCEALNCLVRLYMVTFEDFFVGEVTSAHFAGTVLRGVQVSVFCDGVIIDNCRDAGGRFPFIQPGPWLTHPENKIVQFRQNLEKGDIPDGVALLGIRARAFDVRGGYRSAIIEVSAALDLCLQRKIRQGFSKLGKSQQDIEDLLKSKIRFKDRANKLLHDAVGQSAATLDPALYKRVLAHRENYRHGVTHGDKEPSKTESAEVIKDILQLVNLIEQL